MSLNDDTLNNNISSKLDDNNDEEKRSIDDTKDIDDVDEINLEEGEIDDDDDDEGNKEDDTSKIKHKKSHKRKRKHRSRKKRKNTTVYDDDVYAYEDGYTNKQSPDKKLKGENEDEMKPHSTNNKPQSLLSLPLLINDDNLFKKITSSNENSNDKEDSCDSELDSDNEIDDDNNNNNNNNYDFDCQQNIRKQQVKILNDIFGTTTYSDPTITEKENSKPFKQQQQQQQQQQKMSKKQYNDSVSKKDIKNIKFIESQKEKREQEKKEKIGETICKFYLEGRCTKGDDCQFSHKIQINKKLEICKYYLNGFCAKNTNCTYMHSEFPCKYYHINKECKSGVNCRFSHSPMTSEIREIFDKYLIESNDDSRSSLLGSPPRHLKDDTKQRQIPSLLQTQQTRLPSLMDITVPTKQQPPSLMSQIIDDKPVKSPLMSDLFSQDIDFRCMPITTSTQQNQEELSTDIDERSTILAQPPPPPPPPQNLLDPFLVQLLQQQQQQQNQQSQDLVTTLLPALLTAAAASPANTLNTQPALLSQQNDIILNNLLKNLNQTEPILDTNIEIDGRTDGNLPYRVIPIYIPTSPLWTYPPVKYNNSNNDSECDPRIEFYSNKHNNKNSKSLNLLDEINLPNMVNVNTQIFTCSNTASALSPPQYTNSTIIDESKSINNQLKTTSAQQQQQQPQNSREFRDPRLLNTKSSCAVPTPISELPSLNELLSMQNKNLNKNLSANKSNNQITNSKPDIGTVRLSIADYKRKLQKPNSNSNSDINEINQTKSQISSYAPQIPSYSVSNITSSLNDFKAPQSLHELLKNFPS